MTFSAFVGIALTLAIVLGLLAITLRVVRRMAIGPATGRSQLNMEILRRIPLGPRQGIAVVRIGTQTVAVSVGDGGFPFGFSSGGFAADMISAVEARALWSRFGF